MRRVCVIGGGPAGSSAALAASEEGSSVCLLESSGTLPGSPGSLPRLLRGEEQPGVRSLDSFLDRGVDVRLGVRVSGVSESLRVEGSRSGERFDSLVVATGSAPATAHFPGASKDGGHSLRDRDDYLALRDRLAEYSRAVVSGSGHVAIEVAECMWRLGTQVTVSCPGGLLPPHFSREVRARLSDALAEAGASVSLVRLARAIGSRRVEAAVLGTSVVPCDAVIWVPGRRPSFPAVAADSGPSGGILVDGQMRTSRLGVYSAGDCAEHRVGRTSLLMTLESTARSTGRTAGINAAGGSLTRPPTGLFRKRLFGLTICSAGLGLDEAKSAGLVAEGASSFDDATLCSVIYEKVQSRILGVQCASRGAGPAPELLSLVASGGVTLEDVASLETSGSTDISAVLEAAAEGMRQCRRS